MTAASPWSGCSRARAPAAAEHSHRRLLPLAFAASSCRRLERTPANPRLKPSRVFAGLARSAADRLAGRLILLILDETHTQTVAYGGLTRAWRLEPDIVTLGKPMGNGQPIAAGGIGHGDDAPPPADEHTTPDAAPEDRAAEADDSAPEPDSERAPTVAPEPQTQDDDAVPASSEQEK